VKIGRSCMALAWSGWRNRREAADNSVHLVLKSSPDCKDGMP
jgi:hypothetical protein